MFAVGIVALSGSLQDELPSLAADLRVTAYDARMLLAPGIPGLVLITPDKSRAIELLASLRGRGHDALAFDTTAVVPSATMIQPREAAVHNDGLRALRPEPDALPFRDILVLLRATHETSIESTTTTAKRKFSASRAVLTSGLVMTKKQSRSTATHAYDKHDVLYVFRTGGKRPWLLRDTGTRFEGLGDRLAPTERANFLTIVDVLRRGAPHAAYDEALIGRKVPERLATVAAQGLGTAASQVESTNDAGVDLLCHLLAMWHAKRRG